MNKARIAPIMDIDDETDARGTFLKTLAFLAQKDIFFKKKKEGRRTTHGI